MLQQYFPILIFIIISLVIGFAALFAGFFIRPRHPYRNKLSTYECGFQPIRNARLPFDVRYYLIAILFILFDLEIAFVTPWAVVFRQLRWQAIIPMAIFIALLVLGFLYEWKKGALEWD